MGTLITRDELADLIYRTMNPEIQQDAGWLPTVDGTGNVVSHIAADAILAAGWRNFDVYRTEAERDVSTVIARANGGKPTCIVGERICYWTGTEWR